MKKPILQSKNAFVAYVFGTYEKYIPFYIYFINKNYPNHDVLIFNQGYVSSNVKESINSLKNFYIYENIYPELNEIKGSGGSKALRWLLPRKFFINYKYVYIGDVDVLILKENQLLFDFHKNQMDKFNLPFSNKVRLLPDGQTSKRLTGLHFFEVDPYYDKVETLSNNLLNDKKSDNFDFAGYIEGNHLMDGEVNVIVSDGFTGNVALKTAEGTANFITDELKKAMTGSIIGKISSILNISNLKKFKKRLDPRLYNGAIFIGLDSPVVKSHGGTDFIGFSNSLDVCHRIVKGNLIEKIKQNI